MNAVLNGIDRLLGGLAVLGCLSYAAAAVVTIADIVGRRVGTPIDGVVDLVQLFVIAGAWMAIPYAFARGAHVGVDFVVEALPSVLRRGLVLLAQLCALALLAAMLFYGFAHYNLQSSMGDRSQQLGIPIGVYWVPLLLGQAASLLAILHVILTLARGHEAPNAEIH